MLERVNSWTPSAADATPAGTQTLRALRTKLGIVTHRAMIDGEPVASTRSCAPPTCTRPTRRSASPTSTALEDAGRRRLQGGRRPRSTSPSTGSSSTPSTSRTSTPGPTRCGRDDVDPNFPVTRHARQHLGRTSTRTTVTFDQRRRRPSTRRWSTRATSPAGTTSRRRASAPRTRSTSLRLRPPRRSRSNERIEAGIAGAETMTRAELVDAMEDAATVDLRGSQVLPVGPEGHRRRTSRRPRAGS